MEREKELLPARLAQVVENRKVADEKARPWLLDGRPTQADITVATMLGFLRLVEPATGIAPPDNRHWPHLSRLALLSPSHVQATASARSRTSPATR